MTSPRSTIVTLVYYYSTLEIQASDKRVVKSDWHRQCKASLSHMTILGLPLIVWVIKW